MRNWCTAVILLAALAGCSGEDGAGGTSPLTQPALTTPAATEPSVSTVVDSVSPSTSAEPELAPLPVFEEFHDRAGSLWNVEVLGVVEGFVNPRAVPRSNAQSRCLAIVLHATYLGPEQLGDADGLVFGSADGDSKAWACLPEGLEYPAPNLVLPGTSLVTVVGMIDFEEPLPEVVELFARDAVADTTEYFAATVGPMPEVPEPVAGPTPTSLGDAATPLIHAVADGTVTATIVGAWLTPVEGGLCAQVAASFVVSEEINAITVSAQDLPMLIADGMVQPMRECGAPADGYVIDPNLITYAPGTVYGMSWSYLVPADSELQALVLPGTYTELIALDVLDGPPAAP